MPWQTSRPPTNPISRPRRQQQASLARRPSSRGSPPARRPRYRRPESKSPHKALPRSGHALCPFSLARPATIDLLWRIAENPRLEAVVTPEDAVKSHQGPIGVVVKVAARKPSDPIGLPVRPMAGSRVRPGSPVRPNPENRARPRNPETPRRPGSPVRPRPGSRGNHASRGNRRLMSRSSSHCQTWPHSQMARPR